MTLVWIILQALLAVANAFAFKRRREARDYNWAAVNGAAAVLCTASAVGMTFGLISEWIKGL